MSFPTKPMPEETCGNHCPLCGKFGHDAGAASYKDHCCPECGILWNNNDLVVDFTDTPLSCKSDKNHD